MKCPYRVNEESLCKNGKTYNHKEFAECYGKQCPYFDEYHIFVKLTLVIATT